MKTIKAQAKQQRKNKVIMSLYFRAAQPMPSEFGGSTGFRVELSDIFKDSNLKVELRTLSTHWGRVPSVFVSCEL